MGTETGCRRPWLLPQRHTITCFELVALRNEEKLVVLPQRPRIRRSFKAGWGLSGLKNRHTTRLVRRYDRPLKGQNRSPAVGQGRYLQGFSQPGPAPGLLLAVEVEG